VSGARVQPLKPLPRLGAALATWALFVAASPGVVTQDGLAPVAALALLPWARFCSRPGRRAFVVEWLAGGLGSAALCIWSAYVWWGTLAFIVLVPGLYVAAAGALLRRLARRFPLAVAAPAAWIALEVPRCLIEPPFGFGWMRAGTYLHATPWLAGSARVWGVFGLSVVVAAFAGGWADLARGRRGAAALGLVPAALAVLLALLVRAPETRDGPRVLLVQPAFEQHRKMQAQQAEDLFGESCALTRAGLAEVAVRGEEEPDLVAWGETMLPVPIMAQGLEQAWARGVRSPAWTRDAVGPEQMAWSRAREAQWVGGVLFGQGPRASIVPAGASFLAGCEVFVEHAGEIRRANGVALWDARGERVGLGGKVHLVPGGENLPVLEKVAWVRAAALSIAGYVPDLVAFDAVRVLPLAARDGRATWRFGVTVCFDNVYDDPYTAPLRREPLDFHLVCSNEAWYLDSFEMDQMVAFSRLEAIQTGRSFVRATNAGITLVLGPDGREVARLVREGRDREVAGCLAATVPVPVDPGVKPPYVALERLWLALWVLGPALLLVLALRRAHLAREG
jgi:apolipoprotein N-acyltransferase